MKICKRIITSFVALVTCFSLCATPVLAAWQNELGHWYVNSNFAQWAVGGILSYAGSALGGMAGTIVLPGGGTIEGTALGATAGAAASVGIYDLASYYAAGYTDDDYYTAEDSYVSTLDSTTAQTGISVTGFSASSCTSSGNTRHLAALDALCSSSPADFSVVFSSLGVASKVMVFFVTSSYLGGVFFDSNGQFQYGLFNNPLGIVHASLFGVYNFADLTLAASYPSLGLTFYSKSYAEAYNAFLTSSCYAFDWSASVVHSGNYLRFNRFVKQSVNSVWDSASVSCSYMVTCSSEMGSMVSSGYKVSGTVVWNSSHITVQPSGTDAATRTASLMQTINNYNIDNSYTDNSTTVNYFIGSLGDDGSVTDVYSPALYDEETMVFVEPISGTQYQTTGWTYDYTTRSYDLTLDSGTMTVADTDITQVLCTYGDDAVTISYCDSSGTAVQTDEFAYVMASQSECNINGHTYNVETTKEPTCTAAGERTYTCSICGNQYVEEISKTDHTYADYTITQEPTCTAGGIASYTCSTCGAQITEKLDALGHDWLASEVTETTYSVPEGTSCPDCSGTNYTFTRNGVIYTCTCSDCSAEWTVEADVTYGSTTYTCSRCGETKVEVDATEETQETWFTKFIFKFNWLSSISAIYKQLIADVTSDAATAAAVADGAVLLADVTGDHAATDSETVTYTAPELAISFGASDKYGVDWVNIKPLDLSWYAPHKETVDGILSGILWLSYLFLLIKRAPGIIRGSEMITEDRIKIDNWNIRHRR